MTQRFPIPEVLPRHSSGAKRAIRHLVKQPWACWGLMSPAPDVAHMSQISIVRRNAAWSLDSILDKPETKCNANALCKALTFEI